MGQPHDGPTRLGSKGEEAAGTRPWTSLPYTPCGRCRAQRQCPGRERQSTRRQAGKRLGGTDMLSVLISGYPGGRACQRSQPAQLPTALRVAVREELLQRKRRALCRVLLPGMEATRPQVPPHSLHCYPRTGISLTCGPLPLTCGLLAFHDN